MDHILDILKKLRGEPEIPDDDFDLDDTMPPDHVPLRHNLPSRPSASPPGLGGLTGGGMGGPMGGPGPFGGIPDLSQGRSESPTESNPLRSLFNRPAGLGGAAGQPAPPSRPGGGRMKDVRRRMADGMRPIDNKKFPAPRFVVHFLINTATGVAVTAGVIFILGLIVGVVVLDIVAGATVLEAAPNVMLGGAESPIATRGITSEGLLSKVTIPWIISFLTSAFIFLMFLYGGQAWRDLKRAVKERSLQHVDPGLTFCLVLAIAVSYGDAMFIDRPFTLLWFYPGVDVKLVYKADGELMYKVVTNIWVAWSFLGEFLTTKLVDILKMFLLESEN